MVINTAKAATGGCLCRQVRYELDSGAEPLFGLICHCNNCKKLSGSQIMCASVYSRSQFKVTNGDPAQYIDTQTDSGKPAFRYFCPNCGSQLYCTMAFNEKLVVVFSGSLDEEFNLKWQPNKEQYLCRKTGSLPDFRIVEKAGLPMKHRKGPFGF